MVLAPMRLTMLRCFPRWIMILSSLVSAISWLWSDMFLAILIATVVLRDANWLKECLNE